MTNVNVTNFRKNMFGYINQAVEWGDVINVSTKNGNAIIMSEDDYRGLMETLYLSSNPKLKQVITEGMATPLEECIPSDEVEW